jgi:hypothetical protein
MTRRHFIVTSIIASWASRSPFSKSNSSKPCRCLQCLKTWITNELAKGGAAFLCPVCRTRAEARIFSTEHGAYDRQKLHSGPRGDAKALPNFSPSVAQIARRHAYSGACPAQQTALCLCLSAPRCGTGGDGAGSSSQRPACNHASVATVRDVFDERSSLRCSKDPEAMTWMKRELQALLLCEDTGLAQQVFTSLRLVLDRSIATMDTSSVSPSSSVHCIAPFRADSPW